MQRVKVMVTITARNAVFTTKSEKFLNELLDRAENTNVKKWINSNLRRWLINNYEDVKPIVRTTRIDSDWLRKAVSAGQDVFRIDLQRRDRDTFLHWIDYLNTLDGNINKITPEQMPLHIKRWEAQLQRIADNEEDGIETIHEYSDGFSWVRVFGKQSLNREGKLMNHCVGSYYKQVKKEKTAIYSLRDAQNKPHCTIEIARTTLKQIKGNSNTEVKSQYREYVLDFLDKKYVPYKKIQPNELLNIGLVQIGHDIFDIHHLPSPIKGDLDLAFTSIKELPDGLTVNGNLNLLYTKVKKLPKGLTVNGDLIASYTEIEELPEDLIVKGSIILYFSPIRKLPKGLIVKGDLDLQHTKIKELPKDLVVMGNLNIIGTDINQIPESVRIGGDIIRSMSDE